MTEGIVVDTNVFIASLISEDDPDEEDRKQRPLAAKYIEAMESGEYLVHLPRIALVEIVGVTRAKAGIGLAVAIRNQLTQWVSMGLITLYDLEDHRMTSATDLVMRHNISRRRSLSAPDATFISLAEELGLNLVTFEKYFRSVYSRAILLS